MALVFVALIMSVLVNSEKRRKAYRKLFQSHMPDLYMKEISEALQKEWILGCDRFKQRIQEKLGARRSEHGGDRKSLAFLKNQVL